MTRTEIRELLSELDKYFIKYEVREFQVKLSGGERHAREYYADLIAKEEDVEAMLILELAHKNPDLMYVIEERACISWADGAGYDLLYAVKQHMKVARINEAERQI